MACVQTSVPFRNATRRSCLQKFWYTYISLSFPALYSRDVLKMAENCDESKEEKAKRLAENGNKNREPKCSHYHVKSVQWIQERGAAATAAKNAHGHLKISSHSVRCSKSRSIPRTLSTYALPFFSQCSHFVAHGQPSQKHMPRLLTVMHVSVQRLLKSACEAYSANLYT